MKTLFKTNKASQAEKNVKPIVNLIRKEDDKFFADIQKIHETKGLPQATEVAKDHAEKEMPKEKSNSSLPFEFLTAFYNRLVIDYKSHAQQNHTKYHGNSDVKEHVKLKQRIADKLKEAKNELRIDKATLERLKDVRQKIQIYYKAMFGILMFTMTECIFASSSFLIFAENWLYALIIGITFGVALFYCATIGTKLLRKAKNAVQFWSILLGILSILTLVFYQLGNFRLSYLQQMSEQGGENGLSALQFAFINLFFFMCAMGLKYFFLPTDEEFEQNTTYNKIKARIKTKEDTIKYLEEELINSEKRLKESLISRTLLLSYSADMERRIVTMYEEAYQKYVLTNLHHRKDNVIPQCFEKKNILPPLKLYFQDAKLVEFDEA